MITLFRYVHLSLNLGGTLPTLLPPRYQHCSRRTGVN
jgi:hypothetical protein